MNKKMNYLAFDTSSDTLSVAVAQEGRCLAERTLVGNKNHSVTLMPTISELIRQVDWQPSDIERVVVAQGPGSYTGLRIGVTAAKTLAFTLGCELVGVSSLAGLAASQESDTVVVPIMNARRGFVYAAAYQKGDNRLVDGYYLLESLLERLTEFDYPVLTGDTAIFEKELVDFAKSERPISAFALAQIGMNLPAVKDIHNFNPIYLKRVEAEENWLKGHEESEEGYVRLV